VLLYACTKDSGPVYIPLDYDSSGNPITVSFENDVKGILASECWVCHPNNGDLDLNVNIAYEQMVNVVSTNYPPHMRVVPYDTAASVMYHKVIGDDVYGLMMPPAPLTMTDQQKDILTRWILEGALDN
jgi:hypothetical protein